MILAIGKTLEVPKPLCLLAAPHLAAPPQDLIDDHAKKVSPEDLKGVFAARAINLDQIMRVTGKQLESEAGSGSIARYYCMWSTRPTNQSIKWCRSIHTPQQQASQSIQPGNNK